jgi:hypothetical protein
MGEAGRHPNSLANLKGRTFRDLPERINKKGGPRGIYTVVKDKGYSAIDIKIVFKELAFYTSEELKEAEEKEDNPIILKIIANIYAKALISGDYSKIKDIMEYTIGRPNIEITAKQTIVNQTDPFKQIRANSNITDALIVPDALIITDNDNSH